jgi:Protein of unknown function (DUF3126)
VKPDEIKKLDAYFKRMFNPQIVVKARPRKNDSAEVYLGEEFLGVVYIDDEDGDRSYNFSMAILDVDCCWAAWLVFCQKRRFFRIFARKSSKSPPFF